MPKLFSVNENAGNMISLRMEFLSGGGLKIKIPRVSSKVQSLKLSIYP